MKIIYIEETNGFDAMNFEEVFPNVTLELWEEMQDNRCIQDPNCEDETFEGSALEFGEIDSKFISFIQNEIMDYDASKESNFYIVEE
jgi:hypothetical protein